MASKWFIGDTPRFQCYFYVASVLTDPTTIAFALEGPDGQIYNFNYDDSSVVRTNTGDYYVDTTLSNEGTWKWRWVSTGTVAAADEGEIEVQRSDFG